MAGICRMSESKLIEFEGGAAVMTMTVEADSCGPDRRWRPSSVLTAMQEATFYAQKAMGIAWTDLAPLGALWVVSRINVDLKRLPRLGERITVRAISLKPVKILFPWRFVITGEGGEELGGCKALWNLMDASSRRVTVLPGVIEKVQYQAQEPGYQEVPEAAAELEGLSPLKAAVRPLYTDLDINGHVSHIRYIDWCCNRLGIAVMENRSLMSFRISFMQEVKGQDVVDTELRAEGRRFSFSGYKANAPVFIIDGALSEVI